MCMILVDVNEEFLCKSFPCSTTFNIKFKMYVYLHQKKIVCVTVIVCLSGVVLWVLFYVWMNVCVFSVSANLQFFNILTALPRQRRAVIGRSENGQPIGMTVHLHCVWELWRTNIAAVMTLEMGCRGLWKYTIFPDNPVLVVIISMYNIQFQPFTVL